MGFGQGLSGLNAASQNLDVISNNLANSGTVGYKGSTTSFADIYANSNVGLGARVSAVIQNFSVGNITNTGGQYDVAIDGSEGFFRLVDTQGNVYYSRNGQLNVDANYNLVNASNGMQITGYPVGKIGATPVPLTVPQANIAPQVTDSATLQANLNANATAINSVGTITMTTPAGTYYYRVLSDGTTTPATSNTYLYMDAAGTVAALAGTYTDSAGVTYTVPAALPAITGAQQGPGSAMPLVSGATLASISSSSTAVSVVASAFDPTDTTTFTNSVPLTVYDSLGLSHQLIQYFVKEPSKNSNSVYDVYYTLDGSPMGTGAPNTTTTPATTSNAGYATQLVFDSTGTLVSVSPAAGSSTTATEVNFALPPTATSPVNALDIKISYAGTTQYGSGFSPKITANGYASGDYTGITIAANGDVVASYSNGQTQVIGTIALASFINPEGLKSQGNNVWSETTASGQPSLGQPGSGGLASLQGQALEESNVNISNELVNLIIAQRTYQANAQSIKTQDQVMQTIVNLR
jgi:flagellar hook protein FlgE